MAFVIPQEKLWCATRVEVKDRSAFSACIVESDAISEFGHDKEALLSQAKNRANQLVSTSLRELQATTHKYHVDAVLLIESYQDELETLARKVYKRGSD